MQDDQRSELTVKAAPHRRGFWPTLAMSVKSTPVSLVLIAWLTAIVVLCVWGSSILAPAGIGILASFGVTYIVILGRSS